jgi:hypothetical protein
MHPLFPVACPRAATIEKTQKQSKGKTSLPAADFSVIFTLSVLKEPVFFRTPGALNSALAVIPRLIRKDQAL